MGLRDTLSKGAQTAFTAAGDVPEQVWYYQNATTVYDASTGTVSVVASSVMSSFIFTAFNSRELRNENILPTDQKALVPQANISAVPGVGDYCYRLEQGASVRYDVIGKEQDPAAALWKLQLRKP